MPNSSGGSTSSADACISIVHSLMCHRQGGETEAFAKRAIECLVKKLKDKPEELDGLIQAITLNGAHPTKCATIPRTLDGRLQVAGKKVFPHVIYARIWRWADIQKSELKHNHFCQYAFDLKLDSVCVNPYHYERVISPGIDLNLAGFNLHSEPMGEYQYDYDSGSSPSMVGPNGMFFQGGSSNVHELHPMLAPPSMSSMDNRKPNCNLVHGGGAVALDLINYEQKPQISGLFSNGTDGIFGSSSSSSNTSRAGTSAAGDGNGHHLSASGFWTQGPSTSMLPELMDPSMIFTNHDNQVWIQQKFDSALRSQPPPEHWCNIAYFELDQQVGETFKVRSAYKTITVDGFSNPGHSNRFCLGPLTNVQRTEASERTRLHIGKGISLEYREDGANAGIWLNVLGTGEEDSYSVFVQSYYLDREARRAPGDAVHKIHPFSPLLKIFDLRQCYGQMLQQLEQQSQFVSPAQAAVVTGVGRTQAMSPNPPMSMCSTGIGGGISADDLRRFCVLRLSFLKGWGPDYKRKTIKETPCWIEIHINRALQLLDEVLRSAPSNEPRTMTEYS